VTELFLARPARAAARALLTGLARSADCDYLLASFAAGTLERGALQRAGFLPVPRRGQVWAVRPLAGSSDDGSDPEHRRDPDHRRGPLELDPTRASSWDLTLGDMEVF